MISKAQLNNKIKKLIINKKFYVKFKRSNKIKFEKSYHFASKDPDGNTINHLNSLKKKILDNKYLIEYLLKNKPGKILDLGCGKGWLLSKLNSKWQKFGIDVSKIACGIASKYGNIFCGKIENYKEKDFDIITCLHVIEHLNFPEKLFKIVFRKLKKGGIFIVETPDFDSPAARLFNKKFRLLHDPTHISLFSTESLTRMLNKFKFNIFDIHYPFFETSYFTRKNLLRMLNKNKISPPFYGSVVTIYAKK